MEYKCKPPLERHFEGLCTKTKPAKARIVFHGSSATFLQFNADRNHYDDGVLCLTSSASVAAGYGPNIYVCLLEDTNLLPIHVFEWLRMSDEKLAYWQSLAADGFVIGPSKSTFKCDADETFAYPMFALWNISKCKILGRVHSTSSGNGGPKVEELITSYNALIDAHETDPSLKIAPIYK